MDLVVVTVAFTVMVVGLAVETIVTEPLVTVTVVGLAVETTVAEPLVIVVITVLVVKTVVEDLVTVCDLVTVTGGFVTVAMDFVLVTVTRDDTTSSV